jgi:chemotaxis signal transduction protein
MDEVGEVVRPPAEDYEPVPAGVPKRVREVVLGTFKLSDKLLLLLDLDRAVKLDHRADPAVPGTRSA